MRLKIIFLIWVFMPAYVLSDNSSLQRHAYENNSVYAPLKQALPAGTYVTDKGTIELPAAFQGKPFIIAVRDPDCPVSRKYSSYLRQLQKNNLGLVFLLSGNMASMETAIPTVCQQVSVVSPAWSGGTISTGNISAGE